MERFLLIVHLLGDPIDPTWSLMYTVDRWAECYKAEVRIAKARGSPTNEVDIKSLAVIDAAREGWKMSVYKQIGPSAKRLPSETTPPLS
jgi:hypothetical protein